MVNNFQQTFDKMHIFTSSNYSILTIGYFDQDLCIFEPIGCTYYHFNPLVGTFIPFLVVEDGFRKHGYDSALIMLLQALFTKNMDTSRVLVWGEFSESTVLISFYRKLGFFPTIPSNYPLCFLLPSGTVHGIRGVHESKNFLLEVREPISRKYEQGRVIATTVFNSDDIDKKRKIKPSALQTKLTTDAKDFKCRVCEINLCQDDTFVFCFFKCAADKSFHYKKDQNTSYGVCGLILCFSCQSNFGLNTQSSACPLHDKSNKDFSKHAFNNHASKEYEKLQSIDSKTYFNSCFETTNKLSVLEGNQQDNSSFCENA